MRDKTASSTTHCRSVTISADGIGIFGRDSRANAGFWCVCWCVSSPTNSPGRTPIRRRTFCCFAGLSWRSDRASTTRELCNVASDWADCCAITIRKPRELVSRANRSELRFNILAIRSRFALTTESHRPCRKACLPLMRSRSRARVSR